MKKAIKFKKSIEFYPAFDKRDPDPNKNYGIHGMEILFLLSGERGVTQFLIYTDWQLPHVQEEFFNNPPKYKTSFFRLQPMGADLGYHSPVPLYEGQSVSFEKCSRLGGKPCYYDGSSLNADNFIPEFLAGGIDAVWRKLEELYHERFEGNE